MSFRGVLTWLNGGTFPPVYIIVLSCVFLAIVIIELVLISVPYMTVTEYIFMFCLPFLLPIIVPFLQSRKRQTITPLEIIGLSTWGLIAIASLVKFAWEVTYY